ncbi:hypothetical protein WNB94_12830 [Aquabacterium sp. A3]|uniref:hypothetical protein n=1 Tax=Aquabacterium sp. A3 TaxID=3132829 RepID=UPI00311A229A
MSEMYSTSSAAADASARAAVRWALAAYLSPQQVQQAAALWQPVAPGASSLAGLSRYCREVARQFNLQGREAEIHLDIIRAIKAHQAGLQAAGARPLNAQPAGEQGGDSLPSGWSTSSAWLPSEPGALPSRPGELDALAPCTETGRLVQQVIERMAVHVQRSEGVRADLWAWRQAVVGGFRQARLRGGPARLAQGWLEGRGQHLPGDWPAKGDGTRLINAAYVALAQFLGPVQADACLTQLVREFEQGGDPTLKDIRRYL